jgi:hypothetical protein
MKSHTSPEFDRFREFVRQVVNVPHSEVKAKLDAEKKAREKKKRAKTSPASRVSTDKD